MSQDYTVAKELASLKEIKQSAEQRISELSLNALNYVNDHRLHKSGGGDIDDYYDVIVEWEEDDEESYPVITKFPTSDPGHQMRFAVKYTDSETGTTSYDPLYSSGFDESHVPLYATLSLINNGSKVNSGVYKFIQNSPGEISVEFVGTDEYSDPWPYFDVVVNLSTADQTGVYLKGSYETIKTAFDAHDVTFSMCGVRPKIEGEEPALISGMASFGDIEEDGSFTFILFSDNTSIWHFHPDGTITYSRGGTSQ